MPSNTPSPYRRPWSNTETTALPRSYHVPSIHTMEGIAGNLPRMSSADNGGLEDGNDEPAGDRTRDLRIKSSRVSGQSGALFLFVEHTDRHLVKTRSLRLPGIARTFDIVLS